MRRPAVPARFAVAAIALGMLVACGPGEQPAGKDGEESARTYRVRGILQSLPNPATGAGEMRVRHEAIPDLVGADGEVEGMAAMTMPFPVDAEVNLTGFTAGDVVRFDLQVDWQAARPVAITAIEKLPSETELALD